MTNSMLLFLVKLFAAVLTLIGAALGLRKAYRALQHTKRVQKLFEEARSGRFRAQFTKAEIKEALKGYVEPKCSTIDPANSDGEAYLSDIREPVFEFMDRAMEFSDGRSYILLMADSGMGKTTFCLNYRAHLEKTNADQDVAVISLSGGDCEQRISEIPEKSKCILILDALDEDPGATKDGEKRLEQILTMCMDFQSVIITCRSQFFANDSTIPTETKLPMVGPRRLGQNQNAVLRRFYLSPFDKIQIRCYINQHFPWWNPLKINNRKRAFDLVADVPELSIRPMLLERLPEIARGDEKLTELFELYEFMVSGWAKRESRWIEADKLLAVSQETALSMYQLQGNQYARITKPELDAIANALINKDPQWEHLSTRSLLNRDSEGKFKFSHKSIMEYFVVRAAINEDARAFASPWTPFMKELFISWGYSAEGSQAIDVARRLLTGAASRAAIMPLADTWARPGFNANPDFQLSASRRLRGKGLKRLAPPQWRRSNIAVQDHDGYVLIEDDEFFLKWKLVNAIHEDGSALPTRLADMQRMRDRSPDQRLPSYDEFIALVEGLEVLGRSDLIKDGDFYVISDSPGSRRHLLVSLGRGHVSNHHIRTIDKERPVSVTARVITCYETGVFVSRVYASSITVEQLWVVER